MAKDLFSSVHDLSDGGLWVSLYESAAHRGLGFDINTDPGIRRDAFLFGEAQSRVLVSVETENQAAFESSCQIPVRLLGKVTSGKIHIDGEDFGEVSGYSVLYNNSLPSILER